MLWIYHDEHDPKMIERDDLESYLSDGWRESFRKPGEAETPLDLPDDTPVELEDSFHSLTEKATNLGIKVDGRWSEKRLRAEIEKAS